MTHKKKFIGKGTPEGPYSFCDNKVLGSGAFATVYKGHDKDGNEVAIKVIKKQQIINKGPKLKEFIRREVDQMRELTFEQSTKDCPYCVKYLNSYQTTNNIYIISKYCNGGDQDKQIKENKKFSEQEALKIIAQILLGLSSQHNHNIPHRDLKPENVFIHNDVYLIGDLGFTRKVLDHFETMCGTCGYQGPEFYDRKLGKTNLKVDVWALGCIAHELFFGYNFWTISSSTQKKLTFNEIQKKVVEEEFKLDTSIDLKEETKDFLNKAFIKKVDDRPSVDELVSHRVMKQPIEELFKDMLGDFWGLIRKKMEVASIDEAKQERLEKEKLEQEIQPQQSLEKEIQPQQSLEKEIQPQNSLEYQRQYLNLEVNKLVIKINELMLVSNKYSYVAIEVNKKRSDCIIQTFSLAKQAQLNFSLLFGCVSVKRRPISQSELDLNCTEQIWQAFINNEEVFEPLKLNISCQTYNARLLYYQLKKKFKQKYRGIGENKMQKSLLLFQKRDQPQILIMYITNIVQKCCFDKERNRSSDVYLMKDRVFALVLCFLKEYQDQLIKKTPDIPGLQRAYQIIVNESDDAKDLKIDQVFHTSLNK